MRRLIVLALVALATAAPANAGLVPADCEPGTVPFGAQDWKTFHSHAHWDWCVPYKRTVSGTLQFVAHGQLHNNNGGALQTIFRRFRDALGTSDHPAYDISPDRTCPAPAVDCHFELPFSFDTNIFRRDGWGEIVPQLKHRVSGVDQLPIIDGVVNVQNGDAEQSRNPVTPGGAGFYDHLYATVEITSNNLPVPSLVPGEHIVPTIAPVTWSVRFAQANCSSKANCHNVPVTGFSVHVDPDFHAGDPGVVIASGPISDPTWNPDAGELKQITFDPFAFPGIGFRKVVMRAIQPDTLHNLPEHEGLFSFYVNDGV